MAQQIVILGDAKAYHWEAGTGKKVFIERDPGTEGPILVTGTTSGDVLVQPGVCFCAYRLSGPEGPQGETFGWSQE